MRARSTTETDAVIGDIAGDNVSGAAEILSRSATVFSLLSAELGHQPSLSIEEAQQSICKTCIAVAKAQPEMSSLLRLASEALSAARAETEGCEALKSATDAARRFVQSATESAHGAAMHAVSLIRDGARVLTHSRSSTVLEALIEARRSGKHFEVIATESGPMFEGRKLASELSSRGICVTVIADAGASPFIERAALILVGADKITPEHVVNKIGTRKIAFAAREHGLPIYALCDTSKFIAADYLVEVIRDQRSASELWPVAPVDRYFEPTPIAYFTGVITDLGVLSRTAASRCARSACIDPMLLEVLKTLRDEIR